ncbi:MAG: hypothetical protein CSA60_02065 [Neptuniibacter caesariensis]|uniref:Lipoprotein n=1 Tax=Neptuniibacter caesariensis TaxID=207954 RepID=A0A2G6JNX6_NEPCE|nr:MAG: hypothetical protein CSA60_02065 [Neptuniibacter caesariensis]
MYKPYTLFIAFMMFFALQGCQIKNLKLGSKPDVESPTCRISNAHLDQVQQIETRFLSKPDQRSRIMQSAIRSKDNALLALLLSTPLSSTQQLQQAKRYYAKLVLYPHSSCPGDRYLDIRDQFTSTLLWMRAEHDNLLQENRTLHIKIDALTEIESDLNEEREEQK